MQNYLTIEVLGRRTVIMRESKVTLSVWFVRPSGEHVLIGQVAETSPAGTHDLEHLIAGVGFSLEEEAITGALIMQYGFSTRANWHKATGISKEDVKVYNKFLRNMYWTNRPSTWKISIVDRKLVIEEVK